MSAVSEKHRKTLKPKNKQTKDRTKRSMKIELYCRITCFQNQTYNTQRDGRGFLSILKAGSVPSVYKASNFPEIFVHLAFGTVLLTCSGLTILALCPLLGSVACTTTPGLMI